MNYNLRMITTSTKRYHVNIYTTISKHIDLKDALLSTSYYSPYYEETKRTVNGITKQRKIEIQR